MSTADGSAAPALESSTGRDRALDRFREQAGPFALVLVFAGACIFSGGFATTGNFESVLVGNAYVSLLALGMTFVIISGGIDLSVGSVFALGGVLAAWGAGHGGVLVAVLLPLIVCGLIGLAHGLLIAQGRLAPFIVTLAGMLFARGLLQGISDQGTKTYTVKSGSVFAALGNGTWVPVLTAVAFFAVGGLVLIRSRFGQTVFAVGGSENAATLMGLPVKRTKVLLYVLSGALAGAAGMLNASRLESGVTNIGVGYELTAIAAVIIGGTLLTGGAGSVIGTVCGVLLLAIIQNLIGVHLSSYGSAASDFANGAFLLVVVLVQTLVGRARHA